MSRRTHHGGRRHARTDRPGEPAARTIRDAGADPQAAVPAPTDSSPIAPKAAQEDAVEARDTAAAPGGHRAAALTAGPASTSSTTDDASEAPRDEFRGASPPGPSALPADDRPVCTAPQLRRFIKSRAYVPMHELRRRFAIEGDDDDVTPVALGGGVTVYVGLPTREGRLLGELLQSRDVGYELSLDPVTPIVIGLFPMRPVPRS